MYTGKRATAGAASPAVRVKVLARSLKVETLQFAKSAMPMRLARSSLPSSRATIARAQTTHTVLVNTRFRARGGRHALSPHAHAFLIADLNAYRTCATPGRTLNELGRCACACTRVVCWCAHSCQILYRLLPPHISGHGEGAANTSARIRVPSLPRPLSTKPRSRDGHVHVTAPG